MYAYIITSHRTRITLTDEQYERLLEESKRRGLGIEEFVRRSMDQSYGAETGDTLIEALQNSCGAWTDRDFDGEEYVDRLRRGPGR